MAGWQLTTGGTVDSTPDMTVVSLNTAIACDGEITKWRYRAGISQPFRAIVWRQVSLAASSTQFKIVGINDIPAGVIDTDVTHYVPSDQRIYVAAGDLIGWTAVTSVLRYRDGGTTTLRHTVTEDPAALQTHRIIDINLGPLNREYTIQAVVEQGSTQCKLLSII